MATDPPKPDYRASPDPHLSRSPGMWILLLAVWSIGLGVWVLYIALISYLIVKAFN